MNTDASSLSLLSAGPLVLFTEEKEQKKGSQKQTQQLRQWKATLEKDPIYPSSNIHLSCG